MSFTKEQHSRHRKTKAGIISNMYYAQKRRSLKRGHPEPSYTRKELKDWLFSQKKFHLMYDNWKRLDYQTMYIPTVDRISDDVGYTMNNIQILTCIDNIKKGAKSGKEKAIIQYSIDKKEVINEYESLKQASIVTRICRKNISKCATGNTRSAGGFTWRYK